MSDRDSKADLTPTVIVQRTEGQISSDLDGETVLMSIDSGKYFGMDSVGSRVWALIEQPMSVRGICDILMEEFEVEADQCEREVIEFLRELFAINLARVADAMDQ